VTFEVAGRSRTVDVQPAADGWLVIAGGRRWSASLVSSGLQWSLLLGSVDGVSFESHEVSFEPLGPGRLHVRVDGRVVPVEWNAANARRPRVGTRTGAGPGPETGRVWSIHAPMPGRVVRVLVAPGQTVVANEALVVVEGMKMENALRAPAAGVVRVVLAVPGMSVDTGALLVVIE
jgi:biotin carboxyl carrier protein